jgi:predicted  nucleic acid-binding Zn-ribbon protein
MGWDVKATAGGLAAAVPGVPALTDGVSIQQAAYWLLMGLLILAFSAALIRLLPRAWNVIEATMLSNWRLALLGSAALLLSAAGGWTTWDGMRNFTGESVLSAMFTFGIHGVMLIVAWLIGESFATGMNQVRSPYARSVSAPAVALTVLGGGLLVAALAIYVIRLGISSDQALVSVMAVGAGLIAIALILVFSKSDVVQPYAQGARIIARNAMLWVMFLACMATSVFFSFDSRFNVIFPKDQRERAAEIRTKKQVASVVADIGQTIAARRVSEAEHLFESEGWKAYEEQLTSLSKASEGAEAEIEAHFTRQMEAHRAAIAEQQERIATATSGQAGLAGRKTALTDELSRLKAERPALAAELASKKSELDSRAKEVDAKRVEAMAEDRGVEGTLKEGKGPVYRLRMDELAKLRDYYKIGEERVKDAQKRLDTADKRIAEIERELAGVDGELAKLKGEAETAAQRIKAAEASELDGQGRTVDPARVRAAFERARAEFRREPDAEHLTALHQYCVELYDAMIGTAATKERVHAVDCDPKHATEAAAVIFGLNAGLKSFERNCAGGEKLPDTGGVDALLQFGRNCLQDSGLPGNDVTEMASRLSAIDLNRDDKAHNFVVTLNAFEDGNRLAYLALSIAIGIDSLIFMAGLFGANAVRSPLSDVPTHKARNSQELNAMIETALLPDVFRKARLAAQAMHPVENIDGYSNEVRLDELDPETANEVRDVLNAGAIIGAVRRHDRDGSYLVRSELLEFLNTVIKRELEMNGQKARRGLELDRLEKQIRVALMPHVGATCEIVMQHLDPINEDNGFTSEIYLDQVPAERQPAVLNVLNTGATFQVVQRAPENAEHYWIHKDLYATLARIRARECARDGGALGLAPPARDKARFGGPLAESRPAIADGTAHPTAWAPRDPVAGPTSEADLDTELIEHFATELGMQTNELARYLDLAADIDVRQLRSALHAVLRVERNMMQPVARADQSLGQNIEAARGAYPNAQSLGSRDAQRLADLASRLTDLRTMLLLAPGGAYRNILAKMASELHADEAAGRLDMHQLNKIKYVEDHISELDEADLHDRSGWDGVLKSLKSFHYWLTSIAGGDHPTAGSV